MTARMFSLAILRVREPNRWRSCNLRPVIAHIGPEPAGLGLAVAGCEHWNRRVVGMNLGCGHDMAS